MSGGKLFQSGSLFLLGLLLFVPAGLAASGNSKVDYDRKSDRLSVKADSVSLRELLGIISLRTGVEILMAPEVEQRVTVNVEKKPLPDALKSMGRALGLNQALIFGEKPDGPPLLLRMKILPKGKSDSALLNPVVAAEQEVVARSRVAPVQGSPQADMPAVRWQGRLKELPEAQRQHLEQLASQLEQKNEARAAQQKQRRAERDARRAEQEARQSEREAAQKMADPEGYQRRQQQREEKRRRYLEGLQAAPPQATRPQ